MKKSLSFFVVASAVARRSSLMLMMMLMLISSPPQLHSGYSTVEAFSRVVPSSTSSKPASSFFTFQRGTLLPLICVPHLRHPSSMLSLPYLLFIPFHLRPSSLATPSFGPCYLSLTCNPSLPANFPFLPTFPYFSTSIFTSSQFSLTLPLLPISIYLYMVPCSIGASNCCFYQQILHCSASSSN